MTTSSSDPQQRDRVSSKGRKDRLSAAETKSTILVSIACWLPSMTACASGRMAATLMPQQPSISWVSGPCQSEALGA